MDDTGNDGESDLGDAFVLVAADTERITAAASVDVTRYRVGTIWLC